MNHEHHPTNYSTSVSKDTDNERALQRAIIALKSSSLDNETISWIDIELPIQENTADRFDLIGETPNGNYVLCELKFAKDTSKGDTPEDATKQIVKYRDTIVDYFKRLRAANQKFNLHSNAAYPQLDLDKCINQPVRLIVAANKEYWKKHPHFFKKPEVEYFSINIDGDWFSKQANAPSSSNDTYTPSIPEFTRYWTPV